MPEVQIDNHFKRGTTDHLIRSHNCSVTNTESFAIAPQRIRSHLLLLRSEYGDYFDTESSNCANSPLCTVGGETVRIAYSPVFGYQCVCCLDLIGCAIWLLVKDAFDIKFKHCTVCTEYTVLPKQKI